MVSTRKSYRYLLLFLAIVMLAATSGSILKKLVYSERDQEKIQRKLDGNNALLDHFVHEIKAGGKIPDPKKTEKKSVILLIYCHDSLVYWSGNSISSLSMDTLPDDTSRFSFISNAWYAIKRYPGIDSTIIGLLKISTEYPYQNEFLRNTFIRDLHLPVTTQVSLTKQPNSANIHDWEGEYLFSLSFNRAQKYPWLARYLPPILYLFALLLFLIVINELYKKLPRGTYKNLIILFTAILFFVGRALQVKYLFPGTIYNLELFGPFLFARSLFMPSLGDVLLNSILLLFLIIKFRSDIYFGPSIISDRKFGFRILITLLIVMLAGYFFYSHYIFSSLILNSSINFETFKITGLTIYTFIGLFIVALHLTGMLLLSDYILTLSAGKFRFAALMAIFFLVYVLFILILYANGYSIDIFSFTGFFLFFFFLGHIRYKRPVYYSYSTLLIFVLLFSVYSVYFIARFTELKEKNNMKVMAENLASQHDPVAEYLLEGVSNKLMNDTKLAANLFDPNYSIEEIFNYLQQNYFNAFWGKYKLRWKDCRPFDSFLTDPPHEVEINCYEFYNELIRDKGLPLPNTNFYFIDTLNGRINYLGKITYSLPGPKKEYTLFIELESRLISEELGYPKLLIEEKYNKGGLMPDYSYAKYNKNRLISQSGSFQYSLTLDYYQNNNFSDPGFDHLVYTVDKDNVIMVSKPSPTFFTRLVSFSYIFVFYYFLVLGYLLLKFLSNIEKGIEFNFKNKIQFSILSVLLLSLLLIGGGTIYFSIEQYRKKQHDILSEKIQSVYIEIDHKLAYETNPLTPGWSGSNYDNLGQMLLKFSDVFYSDINLYDPEGNLLASSRPEIFERGLQGEKMNPVAYRKMAIEKQAEFVNHEKIGNLSYLSAYVPYLNAQNKLLAFLNLPYFTKQDVLSKDISTLTVAIINVYVLLILMTIAVAVIISEQITRPLRMIQQKFSEIKLGKHYEEINYPGSDEIGNLVAEYNRMVRELAKSVELLAKSERESAWREMAKQIAHEIKNPLTPMKLSVQQLQRAWKDNIKDFDKHLERVTRTLIEQIEDLSNIASEFSNFAKMPRANNEKINLVERVKSTLDLFTETENIDIRFKCISANIYVMADKEQLSRVFINLIKNAIQSIPENKPGIITLTLGTSDQKAIFTITDNGKGIPVELREKMFTHNFTTKSSGMGMGLAIVKNIIETCKGTITFDTDIKRGTTFYIEIPLYVES
jgi:two-component system nitrogen regulation sensor histidine kinase NtrY